MAHNDHNDDDHINHGESEEEGEVEETPEEREIRLNSARCKKYRHEQLATNGEAFKEKRRLAVKKCREKRQLEQQQQRQQQLALDAGRAYLGMQVNQDAILHQHGTLLNQHLAQNAINFPVIAAMANQAPLTQQLNGRWQPPPPPRAPPIHMGAAPIGLVQPPLLQPTSHNLAAAPTGLVQPPPPPNHVVAAREILHQILLPPPPTNVRRPNPPPIYGVFDFAIESKYFGMPAFPECHAKNHPPVTVKAGKSVREVMSLVGCILEDRLKNQIFWLKVYDGGLTKAEAAAWIRDEKIAGVQNSLIALEQLVAEYGKPPLHWMMVADALGIGEPRNSFGHKWMATLAPFPDIEAIVTAFEMVTKELGTPIILEIDDHKVQALNREIQDLNRNEVALTEMLAGCRKEIDWFRRENQGLWEENQGLWKENQGFRRENQGLRRDNQDKDKQIQSLDTDKENLYQVNQEQARVIQRLLAENQALRQSDNNKRPHDDNTDGPSAKRAKK